MACLTGNKKAERENISNPDPRFRSVSLRTKSFEMKYALKTTK